MTRELKHKACLQKAPLFLVDFNIDTLKYTQYTYQAEICCFRREGHN